MFLKKRTNAFPSCPTFRLCRLVSLNGLFGVLDGLLRYFLAFSVPPSGLLRFLMKRVLPAETAVLVHLKSVRIILLVFHSVVVALFALCAG